MFGGVPAAEVEDLGAYWDAFPALKAALFSDLGSEYLHFGVTDIKKAVEEHGDIRTFEGMFDTAFASFDTVLYRELLGDVQSVNVSKEESVLASQIFERLAGIPLVDQYEAYQLLDNEWTRIAVDLEIVQTEGFEAVKKVDPNMNSRFEKYKKALSSGDPADADSAKEELHKTFATLSQEEQKYANIFLHVVRHPRCGS